MEINPPPPPPPPGSPAATPPSGDTSAWRVGQILEAVALTASGNGRITLGIGSQAVPARTEVPIQAGQKLTVEVANLASQPAFRIIGRTPVNQTAAAAQAILPRQDSVRPLLANLLQLSSTMARTAPVPAQVMHAARNVLQRMPVASQLFTAQGLREAIRDSGLFLESRIDRSEAGRPVALQGDLKANLYRLLETLRQWPGTARAARPSVPGGQPLPDPRPATPGQARPGGAAAAPGARPIPQPPATTPSPLPAARDSTGGRATPAPGPAEARGPRGDATAASPPRPGQPAQAGTQPASTTAATAPSTLARPPPPGPGMVPRATVPSSPGGQPAPGGTGTASQQAAPTTPPPPMRGAPPRALPPAAASLPVNDAAQIHALLTRQVETSLARLQLHQLASVSGEPESRQTEWLLELPVRRDKETDLLNLRIGREPPGRGKGKRETLPIWSASLALEFGELGPVHARVVVQGETVTTVFWIERNETTTLFGRHLAELQRRLEQAGLEVGRLDLYQGSPPTAPAPAAPAPILDEKA